MRYVLMNRELEVLAFDVDVVSGKVFWVQMLGDAVDAPLGLVVDWCEPAPLLEQFLAGRCLSANRSDLPDILAATGARSALELAFRSGGFSCSDSFWYRAERSACTWAQGSFFDNEWNPAFGDAVLRGDWEALARASLATPDVTCGGASRKAWTMTAAGPRLLKAAIGPDSGDVLGEVLTSRLLARLLPAGEYLPYELVEHDGQVCSSCPPLVTSGQELALSWQVLSAAGGPSAEGEWVADYLGNELLGRYADALVRLGVEGARPAVAKQGILALLTFSHDLHARNMGVVRDFEAGTLRVAPLFDFDRAFGLSQHDRMVWACSHPRLASLAFAREFSDFDASWDLSWYDPHALDGFVGEIECVLGGCDVLPEGCTELVSGLFEAQRAYVNDIVRQRGACAAGEAPAPVTER